MNKSQDYNTGLFYVVNETVFSDEKFSNIRIARLWNNASSFLKFLE